MVKFFEVTEDRFDEMLGVVPPCVMDGKGFLVGEAWTHNVDGHPMFAAFIELNGKFYEADGPMTVKDYKALVATDITGGGGPL